MHLKGINYYRSEAFKMIEVKTCSNELHSYKDHLHEELSVGYIEKGATRLNVNGREYFIGEGEAVIIYPFVSHKCQPVDIMNWEFTMIYIDGEFCGEILEGPDNKQSIGIKKLGEAELQKIKKLAEFLKSDESSCNKEIELAGTLIEIFEACDLDIKLESSEKTDLIREYIEEHFLEEIKLGDIEKKFGINKFSLIRSFKSRYNSTPGAYQLQLRINYGRHLLKSCGNIADIALKAGFYDQAHFTREFKKAYGVTPLQYYKDIH